MPRPGARRPSPLKHGAGLDFPEPAGLDPALGQPGRRGQAGGADHRGQRVMAPAHRRPPQAGGKSVGKVLGVEHGDRSAAVVLDASTKRAGAALGRMRSQSVSTRSVSRVHGAEVREVDMRSEQHATECGQRCLVALAGVGRVGQDERVAEIR